LAIPSLIDQITILILEKAVQVCVQKS